MRFADVGITKPAARVEAVLRRMSIPAMGAYGVSMRQHIRRLYWALRLPRPPLIFELDHTAATMRDMAFGLLRIVPDLPVYTIKVDREHAVDLNAIQILHEDTYKLFRQEYAEGLLYYGIFRPARTDALMADVIYAPSYRSAQAWIAAGAKKVVVAKPPRGRHLYAVDKGTPRLFASTRFYELIASRSEIEYTDEAKRTTVFPPARGEKLYRYAYSICHKLRALQKKQAWSPQRDVVLKYLESALNYYEVFRTSRLIPYDLGGLSYDPATQTWLIRGEPFVKFLPHKPVFFRQKFVLRDNQPKLL